MNVFISSTSVVFDFVDVDFNSKSIFDKLLEIIKKKYQEQIEMIPQNWTVYFNAIFTNSKYPLTSKNKIGSYPTDKMKNIAIVIPIPLKSEIGWGVDKDQHLYGKDHYDNLMKNFWELNVNFRNYSNRTDYIIACMVAGIDKSFQEGFTVGGVKIKLKKK